MTERSPSNLQEWTVSGLSGALKRTLEDAFGYVRLRAEISGYRGPVASGHCYFSLKDESARIDAVIWKGQFQRLKVKPQDGLEVIVTGRITTFPGKSSYQIIVDSLEPAGLGALMAMIEERRRRLAAEGLFDETRKRPLPFLPRVVGVVTSPTGAVIRDILHRLSDRFPREVVVWPVRVQGETSAAEVAAAIAGFNALPENGPVPRPDVLIVARGGGSLEDLMSFNDEAVVRAAAASRIPLVAAIGHETDWTLIDMAADRRAPTPTGAAEMVVPVRADLLLTVSDLDRRHREAMLRLSERRKSELRGLMRALPTGESLLTAPRQRLDLALARLAPGLMRNARVHETRLVELRRRLQRQAPEARLREARLRLAALTQRLPGALDRNAERRRERLTAQAGRLRVALSGVTRAETQRIARDGARLRDLDARRLAAARRLVARARERLQNIAQFAASLDYRRVLQRGYAVVRGAGGVIDHASAVTPGLRLEIEFRDGRVAAIAGDAGREPAATEPAEPARAAPRPAPRKPPGGDQGSLF